MNKDTTTISQRFFRSDESRIFVLGSTMLIIWVASLAILWQMKHPFGEELLTVGLAHILGGRAASIAEATRTGIEHKGLITALVVYFDVMMMFILYPLLVFSYRNLVERRFFKLHVQPVFDTAQRNIVRIRGFKIVGIFFFVWFPLWMTGIVVGAVIGYLLGLRTWVTMATVIAGTTCAIVSWVYALTFFFERLSHVHRAIPAAVTAVLVVALAVLRLRSLSKAR